MKKSSYATKQLHLTSVSLPEHDIAPSFLL